MMTEAAKLRAGYFIGAGLIGGKGERNVEAGDEVLFEAQFADEEVVDHVARFELQDDGYTSGYADGGSDDVVFAGRVLLSSPKGLPLASLTNLRSVRPNLPSAPA